MRICFLLEGVNVTTIGVLSSLVVLTLTQIVRDRGSIPHWGTEFISPTVTGSNDHLLFCPHICGIPCGPYENIEVIFI